MVVHACNPSYMGGWGRIAWTWRWRLQWAKITPVRFHLKKKKCDLRNQTRDPFGSTKSIDSKHLSSYSPTVTHQQWLLRALSWIKACDWLAMSALDRGRGRSCRFAIPCLNFSLYRWGNWGQRGRSSLPRSHRGCWQSQNQMLEPGLSLRFILSLPVLLEP